MSHSSYALLMEQDHDTATMKALVFHGPGKISLETVPIPKARAGEVVIRVTLTTICGTDLHILKGEYPVKAGSDHRSRTRGSHSRDRRRRDRI